MKIMSKDKYVHEKWCANIFYNIINSCAKVNIFLLKLTSVNFKTVGSLSLKLITSKDVKLRGYKFFFVRDELKIIEV